jgi:perosamine synthetase
VLDEAESKCLSDALAKGAISGFFGEYIPQFESEFAEYCGCRFGVATNSGTTALHLALATLGIGHGDEVLVSTLTNMATFFSVIYQNARPIPIDIEPDTLNLDPRLLESKLTSKTRAVLVVHLFGHPCNMEPVLQFARRHHLYVIEDCAQAHGATYAGQKVGGLGDIGCFSFYANKIITTGEGGMITTHNAQWAERARNLKGLAFGDRNKFMHRDVGYNYRMTNLQAAIGHAQFGKIDTIIASKRRIAAFYSDRFKRRHDLHLPGEMPYAKSVYWMYHMALVGRAASQREEVMQRLNEKGIETREGFLPYNMQEVFINKGWTRPEECPVARDVAHRGFYLPSGPALGEEELDYVATSLCEILDSL